MSDNNETFEILSHPIRRSIIFLLRGKPETFSKIMESLNIRSGNLSFHLRRMEGFVLNIGGKYTLSQRGRRVSDILLELRNIDLTVEAPEEALTLGNLTVLSFNNRQIREIGREFIIENVTLLRLESDVEPETVQQFILVMKNVQIIEAPKTLYPHIILKLQGFPEFLLY